MTKLSRQLSLFLSVLTIPLALAACGGGSATPKLTLHSCTVGISQAQCGQLRVPENPSDSAGKKIALKVAVVRATGAHPKPDPLFWFAGWGSAGVSDDANNVISAFSQLNVDRDIVFVDQRGTGSTGTRCQLVDDAGLDASSLRRVTQTARRCAQRVGPNLRYYTSAVAVDDFDQVRRALGYDKINLYGGSYGVTTEQIYLLRHGSHVRSAVLDSGSLLDVHIFEQQPPNKQRTLELLFARCAADTACHAAYPNIRRDYARIAARLARAPIAVPGTKLKVDAAAFARVLDDMIAYTPGKAAVPRLTDVVATGQVARAAEGLPRDGAPHGQLASQLLIQCSEPWASWRKAQLDQLSRGTYMESLFRRLGATMRAACAGIPKADVPPEVGQRVHSNVPVLLLSGNEDGADPPANIAHAQRELPNSHTVVFPAAGHGQLGLPCAQALIAEFVASGTASGLDTSCAATAAVQPFDTTD